MRDQKASRSMLAVLNSLGWPVVIGLTLYTGLFILIRKEVITHALLIRYLESHPVSYVATAMFCVGMAALILMAIDGIRQWSTLHRVTLAPPADDPQPVENCAESIAQLEELPNSVQTTLLWQRLANVFSWIQRRGSAEGVEEELKYLADQDSLSQQQNHALVRILIWATPMLGFLGTVIGISEALGGIQVGDGDFEGMMKGLRESLYVAFDTTALALTLSIILMFVQFLVDRFEGQLLSHIEQRVDAEIIGRFEEVGGGHDPVVKSLERLTKAMIGVSGQLVERQAELWQRSLNESQQAWHDTQQGTERLIREQLTEALDDSLDRFTARLDETQQCAEQAATRRWEQLQVAISDNARRLADHQLEMTRQSEILKQAIMATGDVTKLEDALNRNLDSLSDAGRFEETVTSLAATIHLLNTRLKTNQINGPVDLSKTGATEEAA